MELTGQYLGWRGSLSWNRSDFYDLFGPTKRSRKGYAAKFGYDDFLVFEDPRKLTLSYDLEYYDKIDTLPNAQNIGTPFTRLLIAQVGLHYTNAQSSLGAVDEEQRHGGQDTAVVAALGQLPESIAADRWGNLYVSIGSTIVKVASSVGTSADVQGTIRMLCWLLMALTGFKLVGEATVLLHGYDATGRLVQLSWNGAPLVTGVHLEGPFLSPLWPGAHDPIHLRAPDPSPYRACRSRTGRRRWSASAAWRGRRRVRTPLRALPALSRAPGPRGWLGPTPRPT